MTDEGESVISGLMSVSADLSGVIGVVGDCSVLRILAGRGKGRSGDSCFTVIRATAAALRVRVMVLGGVKSGFLAMTTRFMRLRSCFQMTASCTGINHDRSVIDGIKTRCAGHVIVTLTGEPWSNMGGSGLLHSIICSLTLLALSPAPLPL